MNDKLRNMLVLLIIIILFIFLLNGIGKQNSQDNYSLYLSKYNGEINQISYKEITDYDMAQKYLADFVDTYLRDKNKAYELIDEVYKQNEVININLFNKKMNLVIEQTFYSAKIKSYDVKYDTDKVKYYIVRDGGDNIFVFKEKSIMDYSVFLDSSYIDF